MRLRSAWQSPPTYDGPEVVVTHQVVVRGHSPRHLERSEGEVVSPPAVAGRDGGVEGAGAAGLRLSSVELAVVRRVQVVLGGVGVQAGEHLGGRVTRQVEAELFSVAVIATPEAVPRSHHGEGRDENIDAGTC